MRPGSSPTQRASPTSPSYFQRRNSATTTSITSPTSTGPHVKGTYAFLPNGKNDDRSGYIRAQARPVHDLFYNVGGMGADAVRSPNLAKSTQRGARTDFQKQINMGTGLYYDLPGMADRTETKTPNLGKSVFSGDRSSFLKSVNCPQSEYIPLPGMADDINRDRRGSLAFRLATTAYRDAHIKSSHKPTGLVYNVPGMAEQLARDTMKGTAAFRMSPTHRGGGSPVRRTSSPGATGRQPPQGAASPSAPMAPGVIHASKVGARFSVDAYTLPGMAEEAIRSPKGSLAFRTTSPRGDYVRLSRQTHDLYYDIPGMSGVLYTRVGGGSSQRPASPTRQQSAMSPQGGGIIRRGGENVIPSGSSWASPGGDAQPVQPHRRFDSPTRASLCRQEAVQRDLEMRAAHQLSEEQLLVVNPSAANPAAAAAPATIRRGSPLR